MDLSFQERKNDLKIRLLVAEILSKTLVSLFLGHPVCVTEWEEGQHESIGEAEIRLCFLENNKTSQQSQQAENFPSYC